MSSGSSYDAMAAGPRPAAAMGQEGTAKRQTCNVQTAAAARCGCGVCINAEQCGAAVGAAVHFAAPSGYMGDGAGEKSGTQHPPAALPGTLGPTLFA